MGLLFLPSNSQVNREIVLCSGDAGAVAGDDEGDGGEAPGEATTIAVRRRALPFAMVGRGRHRRQTPRPVLPEHRLRGPLELARRRLLPPTLPMVGTSRGLFYWTLAYPPLFAYVERLLALPACLLDPTITDLRRGLG